MVELSKVYIGVIFSVVIFAGMFMFITDGVTKYEYSANLPSGYDSSFNKFKSSLNDINSTTSKIKTQLESVTAQGGLTDYLGFFFNSGYQALKTAASLTGSLFVFADESLTTIGGGMGDFLKIAIYSSLIVIIFVGIIMHAIIKSERL